MGLNLNYIYLDDSEKYAFYIMPKLLYTDKKYKKLTSNAKALYSLMLSRLSLSRKNNWVDEGGRVYICYTIDNIMEDMNCSTGTAVKLLDELDTVKGVGLIERKRLGLKKASYIYVNDFSSVVVKNIVGTMDDNSSSEAWLSETEIDKFSFYKIPKLLFTHKEYKELTGNAKVLYGLMLDRVSLSRQNNWIDEEGRVFINYKLEDMMDDMSCSRDTISRVIKELNNIGLIEKRRQGFGKPSVLYVKDFYSVVYLENEITEVNNGKIAENPYNSSLVRNLEIKKSDNDLLISPKFRNQEVRNLEIKKSEICNSRSTDFRLQEVRNLDSSYTNINNTEINDTNLSNTNLSNPSINEEEAREIDKMDNESNYDYITGLVKQNICYDTLINKYKSPVTIRIINSIVSVLADILCFKKDYVIIEGTKYPYEFVKDKLLCLEIDHIEYILESLNNSKTKIKNVKAYLLTALYNSIDTIDLYYHTEAKADMGTGINSSDT